MTSKVYSATIKFVVYLNILVSTIPAEPGERLIYNVYVKNEPKALAVQFIEKELPEVEGLNRQEGLSQSTNVPRQDRVRTNGIYLQLRRFEAGKRSEYAESRQRLKSQPYKKSLPAVGSPGRAGSQGPVGKNDFKMALNITMPFGQLIMIEQTTKTPPLWSWG